jgi:DNA-binding NtrC family response regulator
MNQQTDKKNDARHGNQPQAQVNKLAEIAGANTTEDALQLVLEMIEDLGAVPEKISLVRDTNTETITSKSRRAAAKSVEIATEVADGKTRLVVTCSGTVSARLKQDIEAVLQVGVISAELCARKLWQPSASSRNLRQNAGLVGDSPSMQSLTSEIEKLGRSSRPAMIRGERGTGKTTIARAIHENSSRTGEFVDLDCTALTESLLESELFGYEKGAFTGALTQKRGMFEAAENGTLFLDEIGDLPLTMQAKLLKAIEQQKIRRLGATKDTKINVRIIAATSKDLVKMKNEGLFREDLFDRLSVLEIMTCPLREKREDIPTIISHQLKEEERLAGKESPYEIEEAAVELLQSQDWPGNIRQLRNFITRIVVNTEGLAPISVEDVRLALETASDRPTRPVLVEAAPQQMARVEQFPQRSSGEIVLPEDVRCYGPNESLNIYLARVTESVIEATLKQHGGNISRAALQMGLHRNTLKVRLATAKQILAQAQAAA